VGVTAKVESPDWASVVAGYEQGTFDSGIVWSANDPSPFKYFNNAMGSATVKPVGTKTFDNYHRFGDTKADALLQDFVAEAMKPSRRTSRTSCRKNTTTPPRWCRCSQDLNGATTRTSTSRDGRHRTTLMPHFPIVLLPRC
jgi:hypothetical protein